MFNNKSCGNGGITLKKRTGHRKVIPAAIVRKPVVLAATALLVALAVTLAATGTLAAQSVATVPHNSIDSKGHYKPN